MNLSEYKAEFIENLNARASAASDFTHSMFVGYVPSCWVTPKNSQILNLAITAGAVLAIALFLWTGSLKTVWTVRCVSLSQISAEAMKYRP